MEWLRVIVLKEKISVSVTIVEAFWNLDLQFDEVKVNIHNKS